MIRLAGGLAWATGLGFGPLGVYGTVYFAKHAEVWHFMGFPTYGDGPFEGIGIQTLGSSPHRLRGSLRG